MGKEIEFESLFDKFIFTIKFIKYLYIFNVILFFFFLYINKNSYFK